jgi:hypothetical protein
MSLRTCPRAAADIMLKGRTACDTRHAGQVTATPEVCCHSLLALVDAAGLSCARCRAPAPPSILLADADVLRVLRLRPATGLQFQRDSYAMPPL